MTYTTHKKCSYCGTELPPDSLECPICGKHLSLEPGSSPDSIPSNAARQSIVGKSAIIPTIIGASLLVVAFAGGILLDNSRRALVEEPISTPELVETMVPTPVPTPTVDSIRLYAFGREIDADGFTAYVGNKPFMLSVELEPEMKHAAVSWSIMDSKGSSGSAILNAGDDGMSCEFTAVNPTGKNELTIRCYGAETVIPVYLWER